MLTSALTQSSETWVGRDTTLSISPEDTPSGVDAEQQDEVVLEQVERLGLDQRTRRINDRMRVQTAQGVTSAELTGVDPGYAAVFRTEVDQGRWIADSDARRLAPALVVNEVLYEQMGSPELGRESVTFYGAEGTADAEQAIVVGVLRADSEQDMGPVAFVHASSLASLPGREGTVRTSDYQVWVPPDQADEIRSRLAAALASTPAGSYGVEIGSVTADDLGFQALAWAVIGVALVILLLGALGLVNISLVTVRFRVREIGIRRSYGATGGRIFVGVLMESVVATVLAGAVGVTGAVALAKAPFVTDAFESIGLVEAPPFPVGAVLMGLGAATAVGILAGALPALIATRIKVIDAIRA